MRTRIGVCAARAPDTVFVYKFPGSRDAQASFDLMNVCITEDEELQCRPLREYYLSVGCEEVDRGRGHARAAGWLPAIKRAGGQSGTVAEAYEQSGRLLD